MYVENSDGKYDEYIAAYKELTIDVAQLMAEENGGGGPNIDELEAMWSNLFKIETKIAEVGVYKTKISIKSLDILNEITFS